MGRAVRSQKDTKHVFYQRPPHPARVPSTRCPQRRPSSRLRTPSFTRRIVKVLEARVVLVAK